MGYRNLLNMATKNSNYLLTRTSEEKIYRYDYRCELILNWYLYKQK